MIYRWFKDQAEFMRTRQALQASERRYRELLESNIIPIMKVDWEGHVLDANHAFLKLVGYTRKDLRAGLIGGSALTPSEYAAADEYSRHQLREKGVSLPLEKEYIRKDGTRVPVLVGVVFHAKPEQHLVCLVIDVTERRNALNALRKANEEMERRVLERTRELQKANEQLLLEIERRKRAEHALQNQAMTDPMTGLHNRRGFDAIATQLIKHARRTRRPLLVITMDLDGLKKVNDSYGHAEGDSMLMSAASILKKTFRTSDVVARMGGDEFAAAVEEDVKDNGKATVLNRLHKNLKAFNQKAEKKYALDMSVGTVELQPQDSQSLGALLAQADAELYAEKRTKKLHAA